MFYHLYILKFLAEYDMSLILKDTSCHL